MKKLLKLQGEERKKKRHGKRIKLKKLMRPVEKEPPCAFGNETNKIQEKQKEEEDHEIDIKNQKLKLQALKNAMKRRKSQKNMVKSKSTSKIKWGSTHDLKKKRKTTTTRKQNKSINKKYIRQQEEEAMDTPKTTSLFSSTTTLKKKKEPMQVVEEESDSPGTLSSITSTSSLSTSPLTTSSLTNSPLTSSPATSPLTSPLIHSPLTSPKMSSPLTSPLVRHGKSPFDGTEKMHGKIKTNKPKLSPIIVREKERNKLKGIKRNYTQSALFNQPKAISSPEILMSNPTTTLEAILIDQSNVHESILKKNPLISKIQKDHVPMQTHPEQQRTTIKKKLNLNVEIKKTAFINAISRYNKSFSYIDQKVQYTSTLIQSKNDMTGKKRINQYSYHEHVLGEGTSSVVMQGVDDTNDRKVAIKMIKRKRFDVHQEVNMLKKLNHPNLVQLYEVIDDALSPHLFLIFEHVNGGALLTLNNEGCVSKTNFHHHQEENIKQLFYGLLLAMDYIHQQDIIHRDIKPSNILVDKIVEQIRLTDFGSAVHIHADQSTFQGTLTFQGPEFFMDQVLDGKSADIYAAGMTLYCMLFGHLPYVTLIRQIQHQRRHALLSLKEFDALDDEALEDAFSNFVVLKTLAMHMDMEKVLLGERKQISSACRTFLLGMLQKDPKKRFSMAEMASHPFLANVHLGGVQTPSCTPEAESPLMASPPPNPPNSSDLEFHSSEPFSEDESVSGVYPADAF